MDVIIAKAKAQAEALAMVQVMGWELVRDKVRVMDRVLAAVMVKVMAELVQAEQALAVIARLPVMDKEHRAKKHLEEVILNLMQWNKLKVQLI